MTSFSDDNDDAPAGRGAVSQDVAVHDFADTAPTVITPFVQPSDSPVPGFLPPDQATTDVHTDDVLPVLPVGGRRARRESLDPDLETGAGWDHPRPATPSPLGRLVVPIALALVSAVALFAAWSHLPANSKAPAVPVGAGGPSASAPPVVAFSASPLPSTSPSAVAPSDTPAASAPAASSPAASSPAASSPAASTPPVLTSFDRKPPVIVLNATGRSGLASKVAASLRAQGWSVVSVGNWRGGAVTSTTSYMVGHLKAAATMQHDLPTVTLVDGLLPGMQKQHLTLVIGSDYKA
jgi:hypothetical protein